jgi:pathogenesis-related protein 1
MAARRRTAPPLLLTVVCPWSAELPPRLPRLRVGGAGSGGYAASMSPARPSLLLALGAALATVALPGCDVLEDAINGPKPPPGGPPPPGFATDMVNAHNAVRSNPSTVGGSPAPSSALTTLSWSETVAARAQAWADGCVYMHSTPELRSLGYGENIAAASPPGSVTTAHVVAGMWGSEARFYDYATNTCDDANPANSAHTCGHYTQLVWRSTSVVGCGRRTCMTGSPFGSGSWDYWVCDYAPPGNYVGQRPY